MDDDSSHPAGSAAVEDRAARTLHHRASREIITRDVASSFRFYVHEEPHPYAGWHYHPEYELHLVLHSRGRYVVGDMVGSYDPGQLVLIGPNVPHLWIAERGPHEVLDDVHVVLHFSDTWIRACQATMPELLGLDPLLAASARGIEFVDSTAARGATAMLAIRDAESKIDRVVRVLDALSILSASPMTERTPLLRTWRPTFDGKNSPLVNSAIDYILANLTKGVLLSDAARRAAMSDSAFSRAFKAGSGQTFTTMVRQLRLAQACRLLETTTDPIASIAGDVGYTNLSNFNRQFRRAYGLTPREHRARSRARLTPASAPASR